MGTDYDKCRTKLEALVARESQNTGRSRNEATTRLQIIDILLFDCLGWARGDCQSEESHNQEYTDYSLSCPHRSLILEAKKEGVYFEVPAGYSGLEYSLRSLCRDDRRIKEAVEQVMNYCQSRGTSLGAICNGHQLVCFVASRNDGSPPFEGKAIVFNSLKKMLDEFLKLWQYLSKPGVQAGNLHRHLLGEDIPVPPEKLSASILSYPGVIGRNNLQVDLQIVVEWIIEDIVKTGEVETNFIKECFCLSGALSQYAMVSRSILQDRYIALFDAELKGPTLVPATTKKGIKEEVLSESLSKRPIILLGDVGVGKTMFIRYLIKVAGADLMESAIALYIDLGSEAMLSPNLQSFLLDSIEQQLRRDYGIDIEDRNFVRGVYHSELMRFSKGIYSDLKESDPQAYRAEEIQLLQGKIENREKHVKECLDHIHKAHRKQIVLFLDNADQRNEDDQQQAFLIAQEFAAHWPMLVFLSIRPQTFHRSKKSGALSGYHPKAFTISPPRVDEVIDKRLRFALKTASGELKLDSVDSNIFVKLQKLQIYLHILLHSFSTNIELMEFIDNICSGNIRLALEFVTTFIGSGHVDTQKILDIEAREQPHRHYTIPLHEFLRAVIYRDNIYYDPRTSSPIVNILDIISADGREHFLIAILIEYIRRMASTGTLGGFIELANIYSYAQGAGFMPYQIDSALRKCLQTELLEGEARRIPTSNDNMPHLARATTVGIYHVIKLIRSFVYMDAVIVDTPILDGKTRQEIKDVDDIDQRLSRATIFCDYLNEQWKLVDTESVGFDWSGVSRDIRRDIEGIIRKTHRYV